MGVVVSVQDAGFNQRDLDRRRKPGYPRGPLVGELGAVQVVKVSGPGGIGEGRVGANARGARSEGRPLNARGRQGPTIWRALSRIDFELVASTGGARRALGRVSAAFLLWCVGSAPALHADQEAEDRLSSGVQVVSELKSRAQARVSILGGLHATGEVDRVAYRKGRLLYEDARASMNAWLDQLLIELDQGGAPGALDVSSTKLAAAADAAESFLAYVDELFLGDRRGNLLPVVVPFAEELLKAGLDIWKESRAAKESARARLTRRLEQLKWRPFEELSHGTDSG